MGSKYIIVPALLLVLTIVLTEVHSKSISPYETIGFDPLGIYSGYGDKQDYNDEGKTWLEQLTGRLSRQVKNSWNGMTDIMKHRINNQVEKVQRYMFSNVMPKFSLSQRQDLPNQYDWLAGI